MQYPESEISPQHLNAHARSVAMNATQKGNATSFARQMHALLISKGDVLQATHILKDRWPRSDANEDFAKRGSDLRQTKAAVSAMTTGDVPSILADDRLQRFWRSSTNSGIGIVTRSNEINPAQNRWN